MAIAQNIFEFQDTKGRIAEPFHVKGGEFYSASPNDTILAGSVVIASAQSTKSTQLNGSSKRFLIEKATANTQFPLGVVGFQIGKAVWSNVTLGADVEVALDGSIAILQAGAAIAAGAPVMVGATPDVIITKTSAGAQVGIALSPAGATGDLVRVLIKTLPVDAT
jgi:hypothetical protein